MASKTQFFSLYIQTPTEVSLKPKIQNVLNEFDFIGEAEGLTRLPEESNAEYKQRIMDLKVHPGGPSYEGIINNVSRAFGYKRTRCLTISLKKTSSGDVIATSPRIDFLPKKVVLYHDWRPNGIELIDREINIYYPTDEGYFISDLVSLINESNYFSASLESEIRPNLHSSNIIRQTSTSFIRKDVIENNKRTVLSAQNLVKDSLVFDENQVFSNEVDVITQPGDFSVDYKNGILESYSVPIGTKFVSYYYNTFPLVLDFSLVKIYSLNDDNYYNLLFNKETQSNGTEVNTLLNSEGVEIINQMYEQLPVFWGE